MEIGSEIRHTYVIEDYFDSSTQVYVIEEGGGFKFFQLPSGFAPTGIVHHSSTSTVYLVGNEVVCKHYALTIPVFTLISFHFILDLDVSGWRFNFQSHLFLLEW